MKISGSKRTSKHSKKLLINDKIDRFTLKFDSFNVIFGFLIILKNFVIPMEQAEASKSKTIEESLLLSTVKNKCETIHQSANKDLKQ